MTADDRDAPSCGRFEGREHVLPVRIYYEDTDFTGVVYHANYLRYFERGRSDALRAAGVSHTDLLGDERPSAFTVVRMEIDFRRPARVDDALQVRTLYERPGRGRVHRPFRPSDTAFTRSARAAGPDPQRDGLTPGGGGPSRPRCRRSPDRPARRSVGPGVGEYIFDILSGELGLTGAKYAGLLPSGLGGDLSEGARLPRQGQTGRPEEVRRKRP
jgi:tol-pal system-associated acyl-CoA thioesterase